MKDERSNCLSYWFPKLASAIPSQVPLTEIIRTDCDLMQLLDGQTPDGFTEFISTLRAACDRIGYPAFLRTGHTSNKHSWDKTCHVLRESKIGNHVAALVEFSECCGIVGMPYNVWAVREWLPGKIIGTAPRYSRMPIRREFRIFIRDHMIECGHPYWPRKAIVRGECTKDVLTGLSAMNRLGEDREAVYGLVSRVAQEFDGYWSVDVLATDRGWFVTDMARGEDSFHWESCLHNPEGRP